MLGNMSTLKSGGKRPKLRQSGLEWVGEVEREARVLNHRKQRAFQRRGMYRFQSASASICGRGFYMPAEVKVQEEIIEWAQTVR